MIGDPRTEHAEDLALLEALPGLPPAEQPAALERLFLNPSPDVRGPAALVGSAILAEDQIVAYLREAASDVLRNAGLEMLKLRGAKALPLCVKLLKDRDSDVVLQAVLVLDHLKDPRALEPLRELLGHANANVVQAVIVAIGNVGHAAAADDLLPFLDGDPWLQFATIQALGALRAPVAVRPLSELLADPILGALAAEALVRIGGADAFRALAPRWVEAPEDDTALEFVAHVLEGLTERAGAVEGLPEALAARLALEPGPGRTAAARCLLVLGGGVHDDEALDALAVDPPSESTVPACLRQRSDLIGPLLERRGTLQRWGFLLAARHPDAVPEAPLANALLAHRGSESLDAIGQVLAAMGGGTPGAAVLTFFDRLPANARVGWGPLLRRHRDVILPELEEHPEISEDTKTVLAVVLRASGPDVASGIVALPPELRPAAVKHVLEWDEVLVRLPWLEWLRRAPEAFAPIAAEVADRAGLAAHLPEIRLLLRDRPSPDLVRLVARLGDRESVPVLLELLAAGDASGLHPFVIDALGRLGGVEARRTLRSVAVAGEERWRRLAVTALARCATTEDEELFRELIDHPDWHIRLACVEVLSRSGKSEDRPALVQLFADPVPLVSKRAAAAFER